MNELNGPSYDLFIYLNQLNNCNPNSSSAQIPNQHEQNYFGAHFCKVTFKHPPPPKPLANYIVNTTAFHAVHNFHGYKRISFKD